MTETNLKISDLIGETFIKIVKTKDIDDADELHFIGEKVIYIMYHEQSCCESVWLDEIHGDLDWLVNSPILKASLYTKKNKVT